MIRIGNGGIKQLSIILKDNCTLTELLLDSAGIGDDGVKYLSSTLDNNCILTTVFLTRNFITHNGAVALISALESNYTITNFKLMGYDCDIEYENQILAGRSRKN